MSKKSRALDEDKLDKVSGGNAELTQYYNSDTGTNTVVFNWDNDKESKDWILEKGLNYVQGEVAPNYLEKAVKQKSIGNKPAWEDKSVTQKPAETVD